MKLRISYSRILSMNGIPDFRAKMFCAKLIIVRSQSDISAKKQIERPANNKLTSSNDFSMHLDHFTETSAAAT